MESDCQELIDPLATAPEALDAKLIIDLANDAIINSTMTARPVACMLQI